MNLTAARKKALRDYYAVAPEARTGREPNWITSDALNAAGLIERGTNGRMVLSAKGSDLVATF